MSRSQFPFLILSSFVKWSPFFSCSLFFFSSFFGRLPSTLFSFLFPLLLRERIIREQPIWMAIRPSSRLAAARYGPKEVSGPHLLPSTIPSSPSLCGPLPRESSILSRIPSTARILSCCSYNPGISDAT